MPRGVDWIAARNSWLESGPPRSYAAVARQFRVSAERVRFVARRDGWHKLAADIDAAELERTKRRIVRSREERHHRIRELADAMLDDLGDRASEAKWSDAPAWLRHLELIEGEPTDIISVADAKEQLLTLMGIAARHMQPLERTAFLAEVREQLVVAEDAG